MHIKVFSIFLWENFVPLCSLLFLFFRLEISVDIFLDLVIPSTHLHISVNPLQ